MSKVHSIITAAALAAAFIAPAQAYARDDKRLDYSLGEMRYKADRASFVISVRNTTAQAIGTANFVCTFVTEDMTPFDAQVVQFNDIPAHGKASKRVTDDTGYAYSASCELTGGRGAGGVGFW